MTSKLIYEAIAIELSKVLAPTLKLYEFNYFFNQAIRLYVNKVYNIYDTNQQTTDDLRVLKVTTTLSPKLAELTGNKAIDYLRSSTYFVDVPDDYLHLLNCVCLFNVKKKHNCWKPDDVMVVGAKKLTADSWSSIVDDVYNRPTKKQPYYYIHNQNDIYLDDALHVSSRNSELPTNTSNGTVPSYNSTDTLHEETSNFKRTFDFYIDGDTTVQQFSAVDKPAGSRHANTSKVRIELRCGNDRSDVFELEAVQIDYLKAPQLIKLTQEQLDSNEDISQIMEFPDYVNQEIINELVNLIMRKTNDPSLQTHFLMTQSIARPTGQSQ